MKAVIMAGGEGTRLRPLTCNIPKPMVPVANKPVMEHIVELLKKHNITDIAVTLQYLPEVIKGYFQDGYDWGVNIKYYVEESPLGTAGSVKNAEDFLDNTFIVISGDAITDIDLTKAIEFHKQKKSMATLVLKPVDVPLEYGVVVTDDSGSITRFLEKPSWGEVFSDTVNTGIYILDPQVLKFFEKNKVFDFSKDLFPMLLKRKLPMYGYITEEYWCDIGDLKAYIQSQQDILDGKLKVKLDLKQTHPGIYIGDDCNISPNAKIKAPCIIGNGCTINEGAEIDAYSIIGDKTVIGRNCRLKRSILWKNCILGKNVQLRATVLCDKVDLKHDVSCFEESVLGSGTVVMQNAVIKPSIKIWPNKTVAEGTEVSSNLIWGTRVTRTIFGNRGVAGEINVDITPEFASKLGASYGAVLKGKGRIAISSDGTHASEMFRYSIMSGLLSSGAEVFNFNKNLLPITRWAIRFHRLDGGIHLSTIENGETRLYIDFMDNTGANIGRPMERKIENSFQREDFSRCEGFSIKPVKNFDNYTKYYLSTVINTCNVDDAGYKIALNSTSNLVLSTMSELLKELGCIVEEEHLKFIDFNNYGASGLKKDVTYFSENVKNKNCSFGISVQENGEKMFLVDDLGRIIDKDTFTALIALILFKKEEGTTLYAPVSASGVLEKIAEANKGSVVRTKTSDQDLMNKLMDSKNGNKEQFLLHFDSFNAVARIIDFMYKNKLSLSQLIDMIPDFHISSKVVKCPWEAKGKVIRELMQQEGKSNKIETLEGVKIFKDKSWVLVLPDAEKPYCNVISESYNQEIADELTGFYSERIQKLSKK